jgi:TRAP-type C4-dicarboxylate transport system substrate-binding protein
MMKKWGAGPSFLTGAEVYLALQRGTLQGSIASISSFVERKLYEPAQYFIMLPYASIQTFLAVNKGFFDRLTPTQQKAIIDASNVIDKNNYGYVMKVMKSDLEEAKKKGKVYFPTAAELAKWTEGSEEVWTETAKGDKNTAEALAKVRALLRR